MAALKHKGEIKVQLGTIELDLEYKSTNLWALTEITGKTPFQIFQRLDGLKDDEVGGAIGVLSDFAFVVPLIMAGLADHKDFRKISQDGLRRKVCKLLDAEAERTKTPLFQLVAELGAKIVPVVINSLGIVQPETEDESPNDKAPEANAEGAQ